MSASANAASVVLSPAPVFLGCRRRRRRWFRLGYRRPSYCSSFAVHAARSPTTRIDFLSRFALVPSSPAISPCPCHLFLPSAARVRGPGASAVSPLPLSSPLARSFSHSTNQPSIPSSHHHQIYVTVPAGARIPACPYYSPVSLLRFPRALSLSYSPSELVHVLHSVSFYHPCLLELAYHTHPRIIRRRRRCLQKRNPCRFI